jgi:hypothetical protein
MTFWDDLKLNFKLSLTTPLLVGSIAIVFIQSAPTLLPETNDDIKRISIQAAVFFTALVISGLTKFYFFFKLGKSKGVVSNATFGSFSSRLLVEWFVVEVRIQLRTLFYSLLLLIPGLVEALRLSLAPVHVFFNKKMEEDDFDPVHASRDALNLNEIRSLSGLLIVNALAIGLQLSVTGGSLFSDGASLAKALLCILVIFFTSYFYYIYINHLYFYYLDKKLPKT